MTFEDILKITAAAGSAPLTALVIKYLSDRKAEKESTHRTEIESGNSAQAAAINSFKDMVASYQQRQKELTEENRELRIENRMLREKHDTLSRIITPMVLLLVDDEEGVIAAIKRLLEGSEFQVTACRNWSEAELHLSTSPDLAIIDLVLPDSTPEETVGRITEYKSEHPSVPVGIITGTTAIENIIAPQRVRIAHKNDVMQSTERFKTFLYSVLNY